MKLILAIILVLAPTAVMAQPTPPIDGYFYHPATATESYLTGVARLRAAQGLYLRHLGQYLSDYEDARSQYIENWDKAVRTRWALRDEYKARTRKPDHLDRRIKQMEMALKRHQVEEMEKQLIEKGILPPRPELKFVYKGHEFKSYEEFKQSDLYWDMIREREERAAQAAKEKAEEQRRQDEAIRNLAKWQKMSPIERQMYFERERRKKMVEELLKEAPPSDRYKVLPLR